mmetsp:Transcript_10359/g.18451  ORF Transcript_10359/g.18451 Transcript_10359/m.18451 type:complete len:140 (-) Transcript_10359:32-451(-)
MSVKVRDLDYVNRRQKLPSQALPPEVRAKLGISRSPSQKSEITLLANAGATLPATGRDGSISGIREKLAQGGESDQLYEGSANVAIVAAMGASGAGTDWVNPCGHAFVRRGTSQQRLESLQEIAKEKRKLMSTGRTRGL